MNSSVPILTYCFTYVKLVMANKHIEVVYLLDGLIHIFIGMNMLWKQQK